MKFARLAYQATWFVTKFCITISIARSNVILLHTFNDPTAAEEDWFGYPLAVDGNHLIIGALFDDANGEDVGQTYLFDAVTGNLMHTFPSGLSMAVDGNHILIGGLRDDTSGEGSSQSQLFDATTGDLLRTFSDPTITSYDAFGRSVAIDGNHVLISAPGDDTNGINVGQVHLFDATTGRLLQTFVDPTATSGDIFGSAVSIHENFVLIGANRYDTFSEDVGQAFLFDSKTGALLQTFDAPKKSKPNSFSDGFAASVAMDGNYVLIGVSGDDTKGSNVGQARLYSAISGKLLQTFNDPTVTRNDRFGASVAIEGNLVLVGAPFDDTNGKDVGQGHLFDAITGNLLHTFNDPTPTRNDAFSTSVSIQGDYVLIGANGDNTNGWRAGQAHLFDISEFTVPEPTTAIMALWMSLFLAGRGKLLGTNNLAFCRNG